MGTHNLYFEAKIRKNVNPCKPQFNDIKVGCKGVSVTRTCFRDAHEIGGNPIYALQNRRTRMNKRYKTCSVFFCKFETLL